MKQTNIQKLQKYSTTCKNPVVVNNYIESYQRYTKDTVENILKLSSLIVEMKQKEQSGELDDSDMKYFCFSVGLTRDGSTFRKFERIGSCVDKFRTYINKLPDSYTTLYEITTLDDELFEQLMENNEIHSYVTLKDIKRLGNKVTNNKQMNYSDSFRVVFDLKTMSDESKKKLGVICKCLYQMKDVEFIVPKDSGSTVGKVSSIGFKGFERPKVTKPVTDVEFQMLEV